MPRVEDEAWSAYIVASCRTSYVCPAIVHSVRQQAKTSLSPSLGVFLTMCKVKQLNQDGWLEVLDAHGAGDQRHDPGIPRDRSLIHSCGGRGELHALFAFRMQLPHKIVNSLRLAA